jgi:hypothetical protein
MLTFGTAGIADPGVMYAYLFNAYTGGTQTYSLPTGYAGMQRLLANAPGVSAQLLVQAEPGCMMCYEGANGSLGGTLLSGGALGDAMSLVCDAPGHWYSFPAGGEWTPS